MLDPLLPGPVPPPRSLSGKSWRLSYRSLAISRFPDQLRTRVRREVALREIARAFLTGAGLTVPGELARVTGLSRPEAGLGNRALVAEGYALSPARGVYHLQPPAEAAGVT